MFGDVADSYIEGWEAQLERQSQEEERYHEVNDCITRIINDPLFDVYQGLIGKNDKLQESVFKYDWLLRPELGLTYSDIFLFELMKNHQDASTEFIVRLANDTLPTDYEDQHKLLTSERTQ